LGAALAPCSDAGAVFFLRRLALAQRDARDRLATQRSVAEDRKARESRQKQPEQHGKHLHGGEWQPKPPLPPCLLSKRGAQVIAVSVSAINRPESIGPTIPRRGKGGARVGQGCGRLRKSPGRAAINRQKGAQQKGRPDGRPLHPHIYTIIV